MMPELVIAKIFNVDPNTLHDGTSNAEVGAWDSLGHLTLVMELEETYGVSISPEESLGMRTVAGIKQVLESRGVVWSG